MVGRNSRQSRHLADTISFASLLADRETDTFYHGKQTWNNTIVKSNLAFGHINIFTYSSYSILLYSQIKEPKKREIMQIFLKNFYVPARIKILKILLKICFFKNICFIVEDCRSNACLSCKILVFFCDFAPLTNVEINNFFLFQKPCFPCSNLICNSINENDFERRIVWYKNRKNLTSTLEMTEVYRHFLLRQVSGN